MLLKKASARKVLELKAKNHKPNPARDQLGIGLSIWSSLYPAEEDSEEESNDKEVLHGLDISEVNSVNEPVCDVVFGHVGKDNTKGCPSISLDHDRLAKDQSQDSGEAQALLLLAEGSSQLEKGSHEVSISFKTGMAVHEGSFHYKVVRKPLIPKKFTKSFGRVPRKPRESSKRLFSMGRNQKEGSKRVPEKVKMPSSCLPLHEHIVLTYHRTTTNQPCVCCAT